MSNGTIRKALVDQCRHDVGHIPVGSEEIISTRKATVHIRKTSAKEIWLSLTAVGVYDGDFFDVASLTEQALLAALPKGSWVKKGGPFDEDRVHVLPDRNAWLDFGYRPYDSSSEEEG